MSTAETLAVGMLGAFAVAFVAGILGAPAWLVWGALIAACALGIAGLGFALFPPKDPRP